MGTTQLFIDGDKQPVNKKEEDELENKLKKKVSTNQFLKEAISLLRNAADNSSGSIGKSCIGFSYPSEPGRDLTIEYFGDPNEKIFEGITFPHLDVKTINDPSPKITSLKVKVEISAYAPYIIMSSVVINKHIFGQEAGLPLTIDRNLILKGSSDPIRLDDGSFIKFLAKSKKMGPDKPG